jgi:hypothetical protein
MDATICSDGEYMIMDSSDVSFIDRREEAIIQAKQLSHSGKKYLVLKVIGYAEQQPTRAVWVDLEDK